ncbi:MAG: FAD-dependent oxidoreductase [Micropepsaceae bacterium]
MKIAVIGGGVAGLGIAWRLAQAGSAVTVFESGALPARTGAATWASAGMLCARLEMGHAPAALAAFAMSARAAWPAFAAEIERTSGISPGFAETGAVVTAAGYAADEAVAAVDGTVARRLEPGLSDHIDSALWAADEARADPRWLALGLARAALRAGVTLVPEARVNRVTESGGRVTGVVTAGGAQRFDHVVLAAGAWTGGLLKVSNVPGPPVRPVKGQMLSLEGNPRAMPVRRLIWAEGVYIVPQADGRIILGATQEEAGFDTSLDETAMEALRWCAVKAVPGLAALKVAERFCGFRPASDDGLPVLGGVGPEGLTLASGQFRNGILFAPLIADSAALHVLEGRLPALARPFAAARFAEAA